MRLVTSILLVSSTPCVGLEQRRLVTRKSDSLRAGFLHQTPDDQNDQQEIAALKAQVASLKLQQAEWKAGPDGQAEKKLSEQHTKDEEQMKTLREELSNEENALAQTQKELQERSVELDVRDQEVRTLEAEVSNLSTPHNSSVEKPSIDDSASAADSNFSRAASSNLSVSLSANATNASNAKTNASEATTNASAPPVKLVVAPPAVNATMVAEVASLKATLNEARVDAAIEKEKNRNLKKIQKTLWDKTQKLFNKVNASLRKTMHQLSEEKTKNQEIREQGLLYFNETKKLEAENENLKKSEKSLQDDKSQMILTMRGVLAQNFQYEKEVEGFKQQLQQQAKDFEKREDMYKKEIAEYRHEQLGHHASMVSSKAASKVSVAASTSIAPPKHNVVASTTQAAAPLPPSVKKVSAAPSSVPEHRQPAPAKEAHLEEAEPVPDMEDLSDLSKLEVGIDKAKRDLDLDA